MRCHLLYSVNSPKWSMSILNLRALVIRSRFAVHNFSLAHGSVKLKAVHASKFCAVRYFHDSRKIFTSERSPASQCSIHLTFSRCAVSPRLSPTVNICKFSRLFCTIYSGNDVYLSLTKLCSTMSQCDIVTVYIIITQSIYQVYNVGSNGGTVQNERFDSTSRGILIIWCLFTAKMSNGPESDVVISSWFSKFFSLETTADR